MSYRGQVKNGVAVLDVELALPEGTGVRVDLIEEPRGEPDEEAPSLYERLGPVIGAAKGLPPDASVNVDHYLYGQPKQ